MKAILIPVKSFERSKRRLAPHFSESARTSLVEAMCEDVFQTVRQVKEVGRVFVISAERRALDQARSFGWDIVTETEEVSQSHSVGLASKYCAVLGAKTLLCLPADTPLLQPADITSILAMARDALSVVLVPSRGSTGTNAVLCTPPNLFRPQFGAGSFARNVNAAQSAGAQVEITRNPRIALDIDEIEDLRVLRERLRSDGATARWLVRHFPSAKS